ncbi:MAG: nucleotidyl transferase AbiEii/AbiGii toxin family protein [Chloroflexota bacterium]|nr:nucleotidyl transferase AbiEii/AbiGii toxin family protein [Chloroflexota bacterium]
MPVPQRYATATAFRAALEARLRQQASGSQTSLGRVRRQVAFERFLARLFHTMPSPWLLKGGYALELRLGDTARSTRDLDLGVPHPERLAAGNEGVGVAVRETLADAAERDLDDWFEFAVGPTMADLDGPPGGCARYPIDCRVDGRIFAQFHVDVSLGDQVAGEPEWLEGHDFLAFAGVPPARLVVTCFPETGPFDTVIASRRWRWSGRGVRRGA